MHERRDRSHGRMRFDTQPMMQVNRANRICESWARLAWIIGDYGSRVRKLIAAKGGCDALKY